MLDHVNGAATEVGNVTRVCDRLHRLAEIDEIDENSFDDVVVVRRVDPAHSEVGVCSMCRA